MADLVVKIEASEELKTLLEDFAKNVAKATEAGGKAEAKPAGKKPDAKKDDAKKAKEEEAPAAEDGDGGDGEDEGGGFTLDQVRVALKEYAALESREAAIQILKDHKAPSINELAPEHFASVMKACGADEA